MKVLMASIGTKGDLYPYLAIGRELRGRGHTVHILSDATKRIAVESVGLGFGEVMSAGDWFAWSEKAFALAEAGSPVLAAIASFKQLLLPSVLPMYRRVCEHDASDEMLLIGDSKALGLRLAQEKFNCPFVRLDLGPSWGPPEAIVTNGGNAIPLLNWLRREVGLPECERLEVWLRNVDLSIGAFPAWFGLAIPGWEPQVEPAPFVFYDGAELHPPAPGLVEFLSQGPAPVLFTVGTANGAARELFEIAVSVIGRLSGRAVLTGPGNYTELRLLDNVLHAQHVPFGEVLSRTAAIVHHGGIGTCAAAMRAGVPQIVVPVLLDQFDTGARIERLGIGMVIGRAELSTERLEQALRDLLASASTRERCLGIARAMSEPDGRFAIADSIERCFLEHRARRHAPGVTVFSVPIENVAL